MDNVVLVPEHEFSEFKNWKSSRGVGMKRIQKNADENLISLSPTNGGVSMRGRWLEGSNIADLVGDMTILNKL